MLNLEKLLPRHYKIIDLFLSGNLSIKQIAEEVSMTPAGIRVIRNSPTFQHELSLRRDQRNKAFDELQTVSRVEHLDRTTKIIEESTEDAASLITELLDTPDKQLALRAASEILDRGGHPKVQRLDQNIKSIAVVLDANDVTRIENTIKLER